MGVSGDVVVTAGMGTCIGSLKVEEKEAGAKACSENCSRELVLSVKKRGMSHAAYRYLLRPHVLRLGVSKSVGEMHGTRTRHMYLFKGGRSKPSMAVSGKRSFGKLVMSSRNAAACRGFPVKSRNATTERIK
jgi:hypothetical protein